MRVAIVGGGVVGLAVSAWLLKQSGCEVRCFEPREPMRRRSLGESRIFRTTHSNPDMVALADRARPLWDEWGRVVGKDLINRRGLIYNGPDTRERLKAMSDAEVSSELVDGAVYLRDLTTHNFMAPSLLDPHAGVIDVNSIRRMLVAETESVLRKENVIDIEQRQTGATVITDSGSWDADSVLIAAGQSTPEVGAMCGFEIRTRLVHVARFAFRSRNRFALPPCWIDSFNGMHMWGLPVQSGVLALGVHWADEPTSMETSAEESMLAQLDMAHKYISSRADRLLPGPIQTLTCVADDSGDALFAQRSGDVLAFWGDNLFKFAPVLGRRIGKAIMDGGLPELPLSQPR